MKKIVLLISILTVSLAFSQFNVDDPPLIAKDTPVWEVLRALGEAAPNHELNPKIAGVSVEKGKRLVLYGHPASDGKKKTKRQSKHFVCTSCHNVEKEDPNLALIDPQARLEYAKEKGLPFLQGSSLYGAVNRSQFYNGDYEKKYGDLVLPARNNLREAIQLCAVECSQGHRLKESELESVLAYLWTLELKLEDLNLKAADLQSLSTAMANKKKNDPGMLKMLKSHYLQGIPAHFVEPPNNRKEGYGLKGNPANGQLIYDLSCMHCHENKRYSFFELDNSKMNFRYLKNHFPRYSHASIYQVSRYGAPSLYGKRAYMPQYTKEKMSNQQMEDLRAYIEQRTK